MADGEAPKTCARCDKELSQGSFSTAMNKHWCLGHFRCCECDEKISGTFYPRGEGEDRKPLCKKCAGITEQNDPNTGSCTACDKAITGSVLIALGKKYHRECLVCAECKESMQGKPFYEKDNKIYCKRDYGIVCGNVCGKCGEIIEADQEIIRALDKVWHDDCFKCAGCNGDLGNSFKMKGELPWCGSC
ncbi:PDZ and LIM domain protein 7-like [Lineus longissimus]|uniref:PDZ and LIM domain protein 7-like n=1 Tax=Lineus longissimus TaxID=88925 RepID=UPI002B4E8F68